MSDVTLFGESPFDAIKRVGPRGESWSARDLMPVVGYSTWQKFEDSILRATVAAANSGVDSATHFEQVSQVTGAGNLGDQERKDYRLTRYACYLVAMNGDPRKPEVAAAQTYFAVRTREAETAPARSLPSKRELAQWVIEAEERAELAEAKVAQLEPAAGSWNTLASAGGDYAVREAAQILDRDPSISTGQNRLFAYLREIGWVDKGNEPYQAQVDCGRLSRRITNGYDHNGEHVATCQARITLKGLHELHKRLGGTGPLLVAA